MVKSGAVLAMVGVMACALTVHGLAGSLRNVNEDERSLLNDLSADDTGKRELHKANEYKRAFPFQKPFNTRVDHDVQNLGLP